jgi:hypothetical protein
VSTREMRQEVDASIFYRRLIKLKVGQPLGKERNRLRGFRCYMDCDGFKRLGNGFDAEYTKTHLQITTNLRLLVMMPRGLDSGCISRT